jgi:hypothetical protein
MRRRSLLLAGSTAPVLVACGQPAVQVFETRSDIDQSIQHCTWRPAKPGGVLLVSLPTWGGSHAQPDPLLAICAAKGWAYLRPNVRAPNRTPQACLSPWVINDLELACATADRLGGPFTRRVLVGESGGGYAALGAYLHARIDIARFIVWNPISDLPDWLAQAQARYPKIAQDILDCTSSTPVALNHRVLRERSPLTQLPGSVDRSRSTLEIYAGVHDGYSGSVPITHAMRFFDALQVRGQDRIPQATFHALATRDPAMMALARQPRGRIADRAVIWRTASGRVSLTIFEGGHEALAAHTAARIADNSNALS